MHAKPARPRGPSLYPNARKTGRALGGPACVYNTGTDRKAIRILSMRIPQSAVAGRSSTMKPDHVTALQGEGARNYVLSATKCQKRSWSVSEQSRAGSFVCGSAGNRRLLRTRSLFQPSREHGAGAGRKKALDPVNAVSVSADQHAGLVPQDSLHNRLRGFFRRDDGDFPEMLFHLSMRLRGD